MRQNLEDIKTPLKGATLIFSAALRKDFARKPAYWVEIYRLMRGKAAIYYVARQWGFMKKDNEQVQDSTLSNNAILNIDRALRYAGKCLTAKIDAGWMMCEEEFNSSPPKVSPVDTESHSISMFVSEWETGPAAKSKVTKQSMTRQKPKTAKDRFEDAQKRRKAKAEW